MMKYECSNKNAIENEDIILDLLLLKKKHKNIQMQYFILLFILMSVIFPCQASVAVYQICLRLQF